MNFRYVTHLFFVSNSLFLHRFFSLSFCLSLCPSLSFFFFLSSRYIRWNYFSCCFSLCFLVFSQCADPFGYSAPSFIKICLIFSTFMTSQQVKLKRVNVPGLRRGRGSSRPFRSRGRGGRYSGSSGGRMGYAPRGGMYHPYAPAYPTPYMPGYPPY